MTRVRRWVIDRAYDSPRQALRSFSAVDVPAITDGRVFVNGRRVRGDGLRLEPGDVLEVTAPRAGRPEPVRIISERDGIVAVDKPAGISTEPDRRGRRGCLLDMAAPMIGVSRCRLRAASRLDLGVSGVVLLTVTREARQQVARWREAGRLRRRYVALVGGRPVAQEGQWDSSVAGRPQHPACTRYAFVAEAHARHGGAVSMMALEPITGRFHQLRVHCAGAGIPILGDLAHGGCRRLVGQDGAVVGLTRVALHAAWCEISEAPPLRWEASIPPKLAEWWKRLGGREQAWSSAVEVSVP